MARKKKKKRKGTPTPPKPETGFGTLKNQVKSARRDLRADRRENARPSEVPSTPAPPPKPPKRRLTEEQLMTEAFDTLAEAFSGVEKYTGRGYVADDVELVSEIPEVEPPSEADDSTAADLLFLEAMATGVERMDAARDALSQKEWAGAAWRTEAQLAALSADELKYLEMTTEHRELLRRSRASGHMRVLNIRRFRLRDAKGEVDAFVRECARSNQRFARIVHGKGRQSKDVAILKPEVVKWCEGEGAPWVLSWAPEVDRSGQFGSLVVELRK
jgi:DNA-nicking Smr family endonuclease